jgi:hypothetical protein
MPEPMAGEGQVLVKTLACGICGPDLHAMKRARRMTEMARIARQAPGWWSRHRDGPRVLLRGRRPWLRDLAAGSLLWDDFLNERHATTVQVGIPIHVLDAETA